MITATTRLTSSLNALVLRAIAEPIVTAPATIRPIPRGTFAPLKARIAPTASAAALTTAPTLVRVLSVFWKIHVAPTIAAPATAPIIAPTAVVTIGIKADTAIPSSVAEPAITKPFVTFSSFWIASYKPTPKPATPTIIAPTANPIRELPNDLPINEAPIIIDPLAPTNAIGFTLFKPSDNACSITSAPIAKPAIVKVRPSPKLPSLLNFVILVMILDTPSAIFQASNAPPIKPTVPNIAPNRVSMSSDHESISSVIPSHSFIFSVILVIGLSSRFFRKS